jgi:thiamine-monophosphate kinase
LPLQELQLIARIRSQARKTGRRGTDPFVVLGIGDDAAALSIPPDNETLVTTDFSIEGVHFRRDWHPPITVGHRCLTRGLSDIAAMGGDPIAAFLSLALPDDIPQRWVDAFLDGLLTLAKRHGVVLAGGDIAQSPSGVLADITVIGSVPQGKAILRSGARPGDHLFVTGELGAPVAMLARMMENPRGRYRSSDCPAHFLPEPQLAVGRYLREKRIATAMIDISDGLSSDLAHICDESGVRAEVQAETIPLASIGRHEVSIDNALHGGDEYQLLFTAPPSKRVPGKIAGVTITHIGYIEEKRSELPQILIFRGSNAEVGYELRPRGWEHFKQATKARSAAPPRRQR